MDVPEARDLAEGLLAEDLPRRWRHTQGVAARARELADRLGDDTDVIEAAAWLHDIGYAPTLVVTGFHPLDGARYLRASTNAEVVIQELVAHHTGALVEAEERGLQSELVDEFGDGEGHAALLDALTACDLTTDPDGARVTPRERVAEILRRYSSEDVVHKAVSRSGAHLVERVARFSAG